MNHMANEECYLELANLLNSTIPTKWEDIILRAEVEEGVVELIYWFKDIQRGKYYSNFNLSSIYGMDKDDEDIVSLKIVKNIRRLYTSLKNEGNEPFTILTFRLDSRGKYNVEYNYSDLSSSTVSERRAKWKKDNHLEYLPD